MKARVVPTMLTDGRNLLKGQRFDSWRVVGSLVAAGRLFAAREVDEISLLDVAAHSESRTISPGIVEIFSEMLTVPLSVGGGIRSLSQIEELLRAGADKVVIGQQAADNPRFVREASSVFGSQSIVVSVDFMEFGSQVRQVLCSTRPQPPKQEARQYAAMQIEAGAGEILLLDVDRDGTLQGPNLEAIQSILCDLSVPFVVGGGIRDSDDALQVIRVGAAGAAIGAAFQFTQLTPLDVSQFLLAHGVEVRRRQ